GRLTEALASFQSALQLHPQDEDALVGAARATQKLGQLQDCLDYWRRAIAVNPEEPRFRGSYALLLEDAKRWDETRRQCRVWLDRQPNNIEALSLWIRCLLQQGNKDEARRQFARLEALKPTNLDELRKRFEKELR
ncbi:MAG: tetratricopeptide repeat protein, partial [Gemmataceae bacterium]